MTRRRSRKPLPGYPIEERFTSREAIENYLSDDRIICLICGRPFKAITGHLAIHEMTADEYKDKYNIPYTYGLARDTTRQMMSKGQKDYYAANPERRQFMAQIIKDCAEARRSGLMKARPRRDFIAREITQRAIELTGHKAQFSNLEKTAFLNALDSGMTQNEAVESIGYSLSGFQGVLRQDPAFRAAVKIAIEAQPFALQARQQRLGKRFENECRRLLQQGYSDHIIADMLGVTAMTVNRRTKKMRAN